MKIRKFESVLENSNELIEECKNRFLSIFDDELLIANFKLDENENGYYLLCCDINTPIKNESVEIFNRLFQIFDNTGCEFNFLNNFLNVKIYNLEDFIDEI